VAEREWIIGRFESSLDGSGDMFHFILFPCNASDGSTFPTSNHFEMISIEGGVGVTRGKLGEYKVRRPSCSQQ
jgi:hypothetical protein